MLFFTIFITCLFQPQLNLIKPEIHPELRLNKKTPQKMESFIFSNTNLFSICNIPV
jgi:hypothetical protein